MTRDSNGIGFYVVPAAAELVEVQSLAREAEALDEIQADMHREAPIQLL